MGRPAAPLFLVCCLAAAPAAAQSWGYADPEGWGRFYPACNGRSQSPIDIRTDNSVASGDSFMKLFQPRGRLSAMGLSYGAAARAVVLDLSRRNITLTTSTLKDQYKLMHAEYHVPSEHTLNNVRYPAERQLVFQSADHTAVISELYRVDNLQPDNMLAHILDAPSGATRTFFPVFDFQNDEFATYHGSLTSPPCTEGVAWQVSTTVHTASTEQLQQLKAFVDEQDATGAGGAPQPGVPNLPYSIAKGNARPLQEPNGRCVDSSPVTDFNTLCTDPAKRKRFFGPH